MSRLWHWIRRGLLALVLLFVAYQLWLLGHVLWWKWVPPAETSFMSLRLDELTGSKPDAELHYRWVPYEKISIHLKRAVIAAEDDKFVDHEGFDWDGIQKAIGELLLADFSRKGFVDGRGLRLPTISVRPGKPNKAASSFASGIIREPLNGEEAVCPVTPETRLWLLSPRQAVENLIWAHDLGAEGLQQSRMINLPGLNVSVSEMIAALEKVAGPDAVKRIRWENDATIQRIVGSWPACWDTTRALALGFKGDTSYEEVIRAHLQDTQGTSGC